MPIDYTTIDAARELGVSPITIRSLIYASSSMASGAFVAAGLPMIVRGVL